MDRQATPPRAPSPWAAPAGRPPTGTGPNRRLLPQPPAPHWPPPAPAGAGGCWPAGPGPRRPRARSWLRAQRGSCGGAHRRAARRCRTPRAPGSSAGKLRPENPTRRATAGPAIRDPDPTPAVPDPPRQPRTPGPPPRAGETPASSGSGTQRPSSNRGRRGPPRQSGQTHSGNDRSSPDPGQLGRARWSRSPGRVAGWRSCRILARRFGVFSRGERWARRARCDRPPAPPAGRSGPPDAGRA